MSPGDLEAIRKQAEAPTAVLTQAELRDILGAIDAAVAVPPPYSRAIEHERRAHRALRGALRRAGALP